MCKVETDRDGNKRYYNDNNQLHKLDGPAVEGIDGSKEWLVNGQCHRLDGPAKERANGDKAWFINDKLHRLDGPAIEYADGGKSWWENNQLHRLDGPAIEHADGSKSWYINGKDLSEQEFNEHPLVKEYKLRQTFERLLNEQKRD